MTRRKATTGSKARVESRFDLHAGRLHLGGRLLGVPPLLVALCLAQAGLSLAASQRALPTHVGNRIVRLATFLKARLALFGSGKVAFLGGTDERA